MEEESNTSPCGISSVTYCWCHTVPFTGMDAELNAERILSQTRAKAKMLELAMHPPPPAHTLQPTHWPLPLSAGWLPRLQCRLSSSCCYETRTDRPELNDNVSVALARGPKQPIRDGLDKHFPNLGSGDLRLIVWDGRSLLSHLRRSLLALFSFPHRLSQWENVPVIVC